MKLYWEEDVKEQDCLIVNMVKYLIVPDVHCREFWKTPVKNILENTDGKVIFLGDYLDGYPDEWEYGVDYEVQVEKKSKVGTMIISSSILSHPNYKSLYLNSYRKTLTNLPELPEFSSLATGCFKSMFQFYLKDGVIIYSTRIISHSISS